MNNDKQFAAFIKERWAIHQRRAKGLPAPWTDDPILQQYRFCNVRREDDRVTRWIHQHWLPGRQQPWFAMVVARMVNWPDTLAELTYPVPWKPEKFVKIMNARKARGEKIFTGAYMIRAIEAKEGETKADYLAKYVFSPLWKRRNEVLYLRNLQDWYDWLLPNYGMGSFIAAQVVADLKWHDQWRSAPDWATFAAPGPGSRRGLNRVLGREVTAPWRDEEWSLAHAQLRERILKLLPLTLKDLDAQNLQNCLCEFDKYMRVKNGEGRPKQLFKPSKEGYGG